MDYAIQEGTLVNPPVDEFSTQSFVPLTIIDETADETADEPTNPKADETPSIAGKSLISLLGISTTLASALTL